MNKAIINAIIWAVVILVDAVVVAAGKGDNIALVLGPILVGSIVSEALVTNTSLVTKKEPAGPEK